MYKFITLLFFCISLVSCTQTQGTPTVTPTKSATSTPFSTNTNTLTPEPTATPEPPYNRITNPDRESEMSFIELVETPTGIGLPSELLAWEIANADRELPLPADFEYFYHKYNSVSDIELGWFGANSNESKNTISRTFSIYRINRTNLQKLVGIDQNAFIVSIQYPHKKFLHVLVTQAQHEKYKNDQKADGDYATDIFLVKGQLSYSSAGFTYPGQSEIGDRLYPAQLGTSKPVAQVNSLILEASKTGAVPDSLTKLILHHVLIAP